MVVNSLGFSIESRGVIGRFWISPLKTSGRDQNLPLVLLMFISLQSLLFLILQWLKIKQCLNYPNFQLSTPLVLLEKLIPSLIIVRLSIVKGAA